jgi:hypothetical protein
MDRGTHSRKGLSIFNNTRMVPRISQMVFCKFALNSFASEQVINHKVTCAIISLVRIMADFKHVEKVKD